MEFSQLGIAPDLLRALEDIGYSVPSPIQEQAIPPSLEGRDVLGLAQTGTGKTCAFAIPILQKLIGEERLPGFPPIRSLILTPTRELAIQIYDSFCDYAKYTDIKCALVYGGVSQYPQIEALGEGIDVLIATPGRLNDLCGQGYIDLSDIEIFVLDEADRMLDMGFLPDVQRIITRMKYAENKQTLFFSATMPKDVQKLVDHLLREDFERVEVTPQSTTVEAIEQSVYLVDRENKKNLLLWVLRDPAIASALVFSRTKIGADRVARDLRRAGIQAEAIHGDKNQMERQKALNDFKNGKISVLVATDIAARGIDISELSHVINYDIPSEPENYVHRIGRTGRAGMSGIAFSFCQADEVPYLRAIEKTIGKKIEVEEANPYPMQEEPKEPRGRRGRSGRGGRKRTPKAQQVQAEPQTAAPAEQTTEHTSEPSGEQKKKRRRPRRRRKPSGEKPAQSAEA